MLVGLILLGVLLLKFGAMPAAFLGSKKVPIEMHVARADGLSPGSSVNYLGVNVGQVMEVHTSPDGTEVVISAVVDGKNLPPANVHGRIRSQIVGGGSNVSLDVPEGEKPEGKLQAHAKVPANFLGVDLLPPEFGQLAAELKLTSQQVRESRVVEHLDQTIQTVNLQLQKAGKLVDTLDSTVSDTKVQENLKVSLQEIRSATESANRIGANLEKFTANLDKMGHDFDAVAQNANSTITKTQGHLDDVSKQLNDRMVQVGRVLDQFQSITGKIDQGKGSAGMLVNDPRLYESLVDSSKELGVALKDMKLLIEQVRQEGFYIHLGGK